MRRRDRLKSALLWRQLWMHMSFRIFHTLPEETVWILMLAIVTFLTWKDKVLFYVYSIRIIILTIIKVQYYQYNFYILLLILIILLLLCYYHIIWYLIIVMNIHEKNNCNMERTVRSINDNQNKIIFNNNNNNKSIIMSKLSLTG